MQHVTPITTFFSAFNRFAPLALALSITAAVSGVLLIFVFDYSLVGGVLLLGGLFGTVKVATNRLISRGKAVALESFSALDCIKSDKRWIGKDAEIVLTNCTHGTAGNIALTLLCKTKSDNWFEFEAWAVGDTVRSSRVTEVTETSARERLETNRSAYIKYFGEPKKA